MHGFTIRQGHNAERAVSELRYDSPQANSPVRLHRPRNWPGQNPLAPIYLDVRPLAQHLFAKVPARFHPPH
jgi:hypothetical protein